MGESLNQKIIFLKDIEGRLKGGITMEFLIAGTSTKGKIYLDAERKLVAPNPMTARAGGVFDQFFLDPLIEYDVVYREANGDLIKTLPDIGPDQALADQIAQNTADLGQSSARVSQNDDSIAVIFEESSTNFEKIGVLQGQVNNSENQVLVLQGDVTNLTGDVGAINTDLDEIDDSNHYMAVSINTPLDSFTPTRLEGDVTISNVDGSFAGGTAVELTFSTAIIPYYIECTTTGITPPSRTTQYDKTVLGLSTTTLELYMFSNDAPDSFDFSLQLFYRLP